MPLPMVHLAVAMRVRRHIGIRNLGTFLLGAIAPDGIHMRVGSTREDKRRVHLFDEEKSLEHRMAQIEGLRAAARKADASFVSGYLTHLATDALWSHLLVRGFRRRMSESACEQELRTLYYRETDKVDFLLYRNAPWRAEAWEAIAVSPAEAFLDLLSAKEIHGWRVRLLRWFTELKEEPAEMPSHFTLEKVEQFIDLATEACIEGLESSFASIGRRLDEQYPEGALA